MNVYIIVQDINAVGVVNIVSRYVAVAEADARTTTETHIHQTQIIAVRLIVMTMIQVSILEQQGQVIQICHGAIRAYARSGFRGATGRLDNLIRFKTLLSRALNPGQNAAMD
jgi:hypothetical protein